MQADKVGTQMGMAQSRVTAANEARAAAKADLVGGLSDAVGGAAQAYAGTAAGQEFLEEQVEN